MTGTSAQTAQRGSSVPTKDVVDPRRASRGQVLVIFAGALLLLMMMTAARGRRVLVLGQLPARAASG